MSLFIWPAALILISVLVGLVRIFKGPTGADRMLAAQLLGTGGVAILLILAFAMQMPALLDVALVYSLLAATAMVVFVRRHWRWDKETEAITDESD
jgi:multicomponent Na+:H+ antiporter subunit F